MPSGHGWSGEENKMVGVREDRFLELVERLQETKVPLIRSATRMGV